MFMLCLIIACIHDFLVDNNSAFFDTSMLGTLFGCQLILFDFKIIITINKLLLVVAVLQHSLMGAP